MANVVGDIAIDVTADVGPLVRELGKGSRSVSGFAAHTKKMSASLDNFSNSTANMGKKLSVVTAAMTAAGVAAFGLVNNVAGSGDKIAKAARSAGMAADDYQELSYAMSQVTDVTQEEFAKSMAFLTRQMGEAADGTQTAVDAFEAIGISQEDIASGAVTTTQAFEKLVSTLNSGTDPAIAAAVSATLLGRAGQRMGGQLIGAAGEVDSLRQEAQDLGLVMSGDALSMSESFGDQMGTIGDQVEGLKRTIAEQLLPVFVNHLLPMVEKKIMPALGDFALKIGELIQWFTDLPGPVLEALGVITTALAAGGPLLLAVAGVAKAFSLLLGTGPIGAFIAIAVVAASAWAAWGDEIKAAIGGALDWVEERFNSMLEFIRSIPAKMQEIGGAIVDGLKQGIQEKWEDFKEYMQSLLPEIPQWARDILDIQSPSKVFAEIGAQIGAGLSEGIASTTADVQRAVSMITGGAVSEAKSGASDILNTMQTLFSKSKPIAAAIALVNTMQGATEALKLPFPANIAAFSKVVATGMGAISAINGASKGGGGGGGVSAPAAAPQSMSSRVALTLVGSENSMFSKSQVRDLINQINEATEDGAIVRLA